VSKILVSIVLLFKNPLTGMQFLLRFHRFRRLLNSVTAALSSRIDAHTLAGPLGCSAFCFPPRCCKPGIKGIPEMSNYHLEQSTNTAEIDIFFQTGAK